ncbi:hypothetical protein QUB63_31545 [Microcoleus sp. ARI1-B5]
MTVDRLTVDRRKKEEERRRNLRNGSREMEVPIREMEVEKWKSEEGRI